MKSAESAESDGAYGGTISKVIRKKVAPKQPILSQKESEEEQGQFLIFEQVEKKRLEKKQPRTTTIDSDEDQEAFQGYRKSTQYPTELSDMMQ